MNLGEHSSWQVAPRNDGRSSLAARSPETDGSLEDTTGFIRVLRTVLPKGVSHIP